jgi:hypothetical protein
MTNASAPIERRSDRRRRGSTELGRPVLDKCGIEDPDATRASTTALRRLGPREPVRNRARRGDRPCSGDGTGGCKHSGLAAGDEVAAYRFVRGLIVDVLGAMTGLLADGTMSP